MPHLPLADALRTALGVTRVARVTTLDRTGVEVACAVRPGGHVLQVCNGKGTTWEEAERGALFETAELHAAENVDPHALVFASAHALRLQHGPGRVWGPESLGSAGWFVAPELWSDDLVVAWVRARELWTGEEILLPAQAVHCPPLGAVDLGPIVWAWASNGMGAHPDPDAATTHALLEATERDQLARMLPDGWTTEVLLSRRLTHDSVRRFAPRAHALAEQIAGGHFEVALFDLTPPSSTPGAIRLPTAGALLLDLEPSPVPLTAGYACRLDRDHALTAAILEAAQSRLTDIHGAREDVRGMQVEDVELLRNLLRSAGAIRSARQMPSLSSREAARPDKAVRSAFRRAGVDRAAVVELASPASEVHVARVVVPSFTVSELLV